MKCLRKMTMSLFQPIRHNHLSLLSLMTKTQSLSSFPSDTLVTSAVTILKHHRSKSRWSHLRSLLTSTKNNGLTPVQFSQIVVHLRNNAHLALRFFNFTIQHSLCSHTLLSYATAIHVLSRSRLKYQALTVIKSAMCVFPSGNDEQTIAGPMSLFQPIRHNHLSLLSLMTKTQSLSSFPSDTLVTSAVTILKHHRSKSRWSHLRSLLTSTKNNGLTPVQFSQIVVHLRNNAHLALRFFNFTIQHSLCSHTLLSYATAIHVLSRSRLKYQALTVIKSAMCVFPSGNDEQTIAGPMALLDALVKSYRACDSAPFVFDLLVEACLESKKIEVAIEIYEKLRSKNVLLRPSTCNSMIELVCKSRGCFAGYDLYRKMFGIDIDNVDGKGLKFVSPSTSTLNVVLVGFVREGLVDKVEEVWEEMERIGCVPNLYSFNVLMSAYCDDERMDECMRVWQEIENKGLKHDAVTYNTVIGGFCGIGEVNKAEEIYREMVTKGVESTCITFEHLISGYCQIGDGNSARLLYEDMCRKDFSPQRSTINLIVKTLCMKNDFSAAVAFCKTAVKKHEAILEKENYEYLIRGLCLEGGMEEALRLQTEMVRGGFEPNSEIYDAFINGYKTQGNETMARKLNKEMLSNQIS